MARRDKIDLTLLQEAGEPPREVADRFRYENDPLEPTSFDRWPLVVQLSDKVEVEWFRQVPALGWWRKEREIEVSGSGTLAVARVVPRGQTEEAFLAVSMYARWTRAHPSTTVETPGRHADISVHRILSDLQSFMDYLDPSHYPMLAAGDLNLCYGATKAPWYERANASSGIASRRSASSFSGHSFQTEEQRHPRLWTAPRTRGTFRPGTPTARRRPRRTASWTTPLHPADSMQT